ncbi:MAG: hypothetical protein P8Y60_15370 [Calditrichota bacterium]
MKLVYSASEKFQHGAIQTLNSRNSMTSYRCKYRDIKNNFEPVEYEIRADSTKKVIEQFIHSRRAEKWNLCEIFTKSQLVIIDTSNNEEYVINSFGEPAQKKIFYWT